MRAILGVLLAIAPSVAFAEEWKTLNDAEILQVLTGKHVEYVAARQEFLGSGITIYDTGEKANGRWSVNRDRYCSTWPPSSEITCYVVEQNSQDTTRVRFTGPKGEVSNGRIVSLP
ncbi:MAG: hypothetical protein ABJO67_05995 [Pseudoruegeria sp.]